MASDWRSAFFLQARSDYDLLRRLMREETPLCQRLHYLQMVTEKLSKGFRTPAGSLPQDVTHEVFVRFIDTAKTNSLIQRATGLSRSDQYRSYLESLKPVARDIQDLAPTRAIQRPNPEYPWEQAGGVIAPTEYDFPQLQFHLPRVRKMLIFIEQCFTIL